MVWVLTVLLQFQKSKILKDFLLIMTEDLNNRIFTLRDRIKNDLKEFVTLLPVEKAREIQNEMNRLERLFNDVMDADGQPRAES